LKRNSIIVYQGKAIFKHLLFFVLLSSLSLTVSANKDAKHDIKLSKILKRELSLAQKISKSRKHRDPNLLYRIIENSSELFFVTQRIENRAFLKAPVKERLRKKKEYFFRGSTKIFQQLNGLSQKFVKGYPKYPKVGKVYFTLGILAAEVEKKLLAIEYLKRAVQTSRNLPEIQILAYDKLAEIYYNDKKYKLASPIYSILLEKRNALWWSKYAYNQAWCFLKFQRYDDALGLLKKVIYFRKKGRQVEFKREALKNSYIFYIYAERFREGAKLLQKMYPEGLYDMIKLGISKGFMKDSIYALQLAKNSMYKNREEYYDFVFRVLELLKEDKAFAFFHSELQSLKKYIVKRKIPKKLKKDYNQNFKNYLAEIQGYIAKNPFKNNSIINQRVSILFLLLDILLITDPSKKYKYTMYKGDLYFYQGKMNKALISYYNAAKMAPKKDQKFIKKVVLSMLASLSKLKENKANTKYYKYAYETYVKISPKDSKSLIFYPKIFTIYFTAKNYSKSHKVLYEFKSHFPRAIKDQNRMLKSLMDYYQKKDDYTNFNRYVREIEKGIFKFPKTETTKLRHLANRMFFTYATRIMQKKDYKTALKHFKLIVRNNEFHLDVKQKSSYNIFFIYWEMKKPDPSVEWLIKWYKQLSPKEREKNRSTLFDITMKLYIDRNFKLASKLSAYSYSAFCSTNISEKEELFYNTVSYNFAEKKKAFVANALKTYKKCGISDSFAKAVIIELMNDILHLKDSSLYDYYFKNIKQLRIISEYLVESLFIFYNQLEFEGHKKLASAYRNFYRKSVNLLSPNNPTRRMTQSHFTAKNLIAEYKKLPAIRLSFPIENFMNQVQKYSERLDLYERKMTSSMEHKNPATSVIGHKFIGDIYQDFSDKLENFNPKNLPIGVSKKELQQYVADFKVNIKEQLITPLRKKAKSFYRDGETIANKNNLLTFENKIYYRGTNKDVIPVYVPYTEGIYLK
jgi:hypothetical protein